MMTDIEQLINNELERMRKEEEIICPECGYVWELGDHLEYVTYYGEEGPQDDECPSCECMVTVNEIVRRTFEVIARDA